MSWKCSRLYWYVGSFDLHIFHHALDGWTRPPLYATIGERLFGHWFEVFIWPLRHAEQRWHEHVVPGALSRSDYDARRSA